MPINNGDLIKGTPSEIWLYENGCRHLIPDPPTLLATWNWSDVHIIPDSDVMALPRSYDLTSALKIVGGNYGWAAVNPRKIVPGWFGAEDQGAGIAIADINGNGRPDLVVFHLDNPGGQNHGYYRIGWNLDASANVTGGWSNVMPVPGWFGADDQGAGIAIADINGNGRPDLVVFHLDNPSGENHGYYRIGWDLDVNGNVTGGWSNVMSVPGWFGAQDQGANIAIADISCSGQYDLIVFSIDNPAGENRGYYRIGWNLDINGNITGGWSKVKPIPGWFGTQNQGAGIAAFLDYGGNAIVAVHVDNPTGENAIYHRVTDLDQRGNTIAGWSSAIPLPNPTGVGWETQGIAVATGYITGRNRPDLVVFFIDNASGENGGYYFLSEILVGVP